MFGEPEAEAALCVAGSEDRQAGDSVDGNLLTILEIDVELGKVLDGRDHKAYPGGLLIENGGEGQIGLVEGDGGACDSLELLRAGDVIEVGVGDDDLLEGEFVPGEDAENAWDVGAWIDDDCFF